jgi:hypothetical protein
MLREDDIRIDLGRCVGGSFLRVTHIPTGLTRSIAPVHGLRPHELIRKWLDEIEADLAQRGLGQYILPDRRRWRGKLR